MSTSKLVLALFGLTFGTGCGAALVPGDASSDGSIVDTGIRDVPFADAGTDTSPADAGRTCTSNADCPTSTQCTGAPGCAVPWTCTPDTGIACSTIATLFCACDGTQFTASPDCPGRQYATQGPCPNPPVFCTLPDGTTCAVGATCPAGDGCNTCFCQSPGHPLCTGNACVSDGGGVGCNSNADCSGGLVCSGPSGCAVPWTCQRPIPCGFGTSAYCGCDGATFTAPSGCPGRPVQYFGACESPDAGSTDGGISDGGVFGCQSDADCPGGLVCSGPPGCAVPWVCQPPVPCFHGSSTYCGCDGVTFTATTGCPGRPFLYVGACGPGSDGGVLDGGIPDGGVFDGGGVGDYCTLPSGWYCPIGGTCAAGDGCNDCTCDPSGTLRCTERPCAVDAGSPPSECVTNRDCASDQQCVGAPGCGTPWTCVTFRDPPPCIPHMAPFCLCTGQTVYASSTCPAGQYQYVGPCGVL